MPSKEKEICFANHMNEAATPIWINLVGVSVHRRRLCCVPNLRQGSQVPQLRPNKLQQFFRHMVEVTSPKCMHRHLWSQKGWST